MKKKIKWDNMPKICKHFVMFGIIVVLSVLLGCCSLVLTAIPSDLNLIKTLLEDKYVLFMNIWPIFLIMLLLYFATARIWVSFLATSLLTFIVAEVYRFKMFFRDDPFVFEDLLLINEAKDMIGKYELFLDKVSFLAIVFIVVTTIGCVFLKKSSMNKWIRCVGVLLTILLLVGSVDKLYFKDSEIYNETWHYQFGNQWKEGNQYMSRGVVYSFIRSIPSAFITPPDGYVEKDMETFIGQYQDSDIPEENKVHIISIMLEAYNDFSQFEGVEFVEDPYKNFHALQAQSYYGKLFTNIFAANTILTERSFLTGYDNLSFRDKETESFVRYFKSQGYYTEAMHPCYGWFYNRQNVNINLGFDNFDYQENAYSNIPTEELERPKYHDLLSDYDFFDYIIEGYEAAVGNDQWYFNFSVTYQNHGPYWDGKETNIEYLKKKEEYTEAEYNIINNYLRGIAYTDEALKKLQDYIDAQNEPIVLILFGDHNPWLGDGNSVYSMLGINLNLGTTDGAENYYQTPYIIYANEAAKKAIGKTFEGQGNTVSPMFLMSEFFEYAGWSGSAYMSYLQELKQETPVINSVFVKTQDGYVPRSELADADRLKELKYLEYYMKYDK